jgi:starch phosphorylase
VSGWAIEHSEQGDPAALDANSLYDKLERVVLPLYYRDRDGFAEVMRSAIALNGSFFNTQRMVTQYVAKAYFA